MHMVRLVRPVRVHDDFLPAGTQLCVNKRELRHLLQHGGKVRIKKFCGMEKLDEEPRSINWEKVGATREDIARNLRFGILKTVIVFVLITAFWDLLIGQYILIPYTKAKLQPAADTQQILGLYFAIAANLLGFTIWSSAFDAGFKLKTSMDTYIIVCNILVAIVNTTFNLFLTVLAADFTEALAANDSAAQRLWVRFEETLVPGWLFSGFLIGNTLGLVMPFLQNTLLLYIVFVWRCLPQWTNQVIVKFIPWNPDPTKALSVRQAEHAFTPKDLAIAWDYADMIVTPCICTLTLFILSNRVGQLFKWMFVWVVFRYCFHRFVVLRTSRKQAHANSQLDEVARYFWGLPLSFLAAASAYWFAVPYERNQCFLYGAIAFAVAYAVYCRGLWWISDRTLKEKPQYAELDLKYEDVQHHFVCDYFNANLVHVLKSNYCKDQIIGNPEAECLYEPGKEYLLIDSWLEEAEHANRMASP